jgi:excisionase family DNA binding protein
MDKHIQTNQVKTKLLRANEVASILDISRSHAYLLLQEGKIPTVRINRCVRVLPEDLENYMERNRTMRKIT